MLTHCILYTICFVSWPVHIQCLLDSLFSSSYWWKVSFAFNIYSGFQSYTVPLLRAHLVWFLSNDSHSCYPCHITLSILALIFANFVWFLSAQLTFLLCIGSYSYHSQGRHAPGMLLILNRSTARNQCRLLVGNLCVFFYFIRPTASYFKFANKFSK